MKPGNVIENGVYGGKRVVFRYPKMSDAKEAMRTVNSIVEEVAEVGTTKKVTLNREKELLSKSLKYTKNREKVSIITYVDGCAGFASADKGDGPFFHTASVGIMIRKDIRGLGIGKRLMEIVEEEAKKKLGVKILTLSVYHTNKVARRLYRKLGYREIGKIKNGAFHGKRYKDLIYMVKYL